MKKVSASLSALLLAGVLTQAQAAPVLQLTSPDVSEGRPLAAAQVFNGMGCTGGNQSPALNWTNLPAGTKSLAVTAYDPDAPTGSGWWHWVVVNLPASTKGLPAGAATGKGLPAGALELRTDFGQPGYGGACPPPGHGMHRYQFTVWALSVDKLPLEASSSPAMAGFMIRQHALGQATLTGTYAR
ncbi:YbhB/YbcL family Raf kinase inhibitor-like protein [Laribacter hongkongensis]|uniref:YbhB/YbcL family Raf kinase inhibitor-like protein n=3 Tax=Laribacter hongkongensis TaxID=168471 RepID=UPI0023D7C7D2|nr:YbhB/YbcL family Raf kinase inhibitor-like protein [Laribacter hongkongensis]